MSKASSTADAKAESWTERWQHWIAVLSSALLHLLLLLLVMLTPPITMAPPQGAAAGGSRMAVDFIGATTPQPTLAPPVNKPPTPKSATKKAPASRVQATRVVVAEDPLPPDEEVMRYAEELVDVSEFRFPRAEIRKPELQMARTLVEQLADRWDPSQYADEYRANLMKIIKAKLKGKKPQLVENVKPHQAEVVDLMERLRRSLQGAGGKPRSTSTRTSTRVRVKSPARPSRP